MGCHIYDNFTPGRFRHRAVAQRLLDCLVCRQLAVYEADRPVETALGRSCLFLKTAGAQVIEDIVVEIDTLAGTGAFDIFEEIGAGVIGQTGGVVPHPADDSLQLLFAP